MSKTRIGDLGEGSYMDNINSNFDANSIEDDGDYSNLKGVIGGNIMQAGRAKGRNEEETKETGFDTNTQDRNFATNQSNLPLISADINDTDPSLNSSPDVKKQLINHDP